jgi:ATP-dependent Clp protease protease subunit
MYQYKNQRPTGSDFDEEEIIITKPSRGQSQVHGNEIYFYSDVSLGSIFSLNKAIADLEKQMLITQIQLGMPKPPHVKLFINSDGGEIFSAFTTVDRISTCKVPIHTYVEGIAASAATLISVCGKRRYIGKTGVMLVHQLRSWCGGTHENFKDEAKNLEMLSDKIQKIYLEHTKFTKADLDEILKHDIYLSAEECVKYGLVDEIL